MSNLSQIFGDNLRRIRKNLKLSQEELARRSGITRTYIGNLERAEKNITLNKAHIIAKTLGVSIADLCENKK